MGSVGQCKPIWYPCDVAGDAEKEARENEGDLLDTLDPQEEGRICPALRTWRTKTALGWGAGLE
jgi:hypothetical protein